MRLDAIRRSCRAPHFARIASFDCMQEARSSCAAPCIRPALAYCCPRRKTRRFAFSDNRCAQTISCWPGRVQGWIYSCRPELRCSFLSSDRLNPFRAARYGYVTAPMPAPRVSQRLFSTSGTGSAPRRHRPITGEPSSARRLRRRESWRSIVSQAHASPPSCPRANSLTELSRAPITLSDLSRHCGVAERTLEYGFRQVYGTTPLAFIRSQRLTRSRMALLHSRMHTSISETARACGFTHMGQFSHDYRMLFGESPSATLQRARQRRSTQIAAAAPAGIVSLRT